MTEGQIKAIEAVDTIIRYIESIDGDLREGLSRTPERVIESFKEIYSGYGDDARNSVSYIQFRGL